MTTPTQADRLAEQIKRALAAYEIPAHVQSSVSEDLASLAALAKQQASPDAQERAPYITDEQVTEWADGFIQQKAFNRPVAIQIAIRAAQWVRDQYEPSLNGLSDALRAEIESPIFLGEPLATTPSAPQCEQAALPATVRVPSTLELAAIGREHFGNPIPREWYAAAQHLLTALAQGTTPAALQSVAYTYSSQQATKCAGCGLHKHTPLRIDAMGGYVCLTCIDQKLGSLLGEFGYPEPAAGVGEQAQAEPMSDERYPPMRTPVAWRVWNGKWVYFDDQPNWNLSPVFALYGASSTEGSA